MRLCASGDYNTPATLTQPNRHETAPHGWHGGQPSCARPFRFHNRQTMMRVEIVSSSPEQTQAIGRVLGARAQPGDVVLLVGELGAGKTCLAQGILWGLGVDEFARSPTFVMINEYEGRLPLYHIDLYRIDADAEIAELGLDEYLSGEGICVVEWPERSRYAYPLERVEIKLEHIDETTRKLTLTSASERFDSTLQAVESAATAG